MTIAIGWKMWICAVKKLFKINHENTKVRKHETRHRNELSALWASKNGNSYTIKLVAYCGTFLTG